MLIGGSEMEEFVKNVPKCFKKKEKIKKALPCLHISKNFTNFAASFRKGDKTY